jgi:hypothetical protein
MAEKKIGHLLIKKSSGGWMSPVDFCVKLGSEM